MRMHFPIDAFLRLHFTLYLVRLECPPYILHPDVSFSSRSATEAFTISGTRYLEHITESQVKLTAEIVLA